MCNNTEEGPKVQDSTLQQQIQDALDTIVIATALLVERRTEDRSCAQCRQDAIEANDRMAKAEAALLWERQRRIDEMRELRVSCGCPPKLSIPRFVDQLHDLNRLLAHRENDELRAAWREAAGDVLK